MQASSLIDHSSPIKHEETALAHAKADPNGDFSIDIDHYETSLDSENSRTDSGYKADPSTDPPPNPPRHSVFHEIDRFVTSGDKTTEPKSMLDPELFGGYLLISALVYLMSLLIKGRD